MEDRVERVAAFVDAGYFWVQLSYLLYGEKRRREDILIDAPKMRESLIHEIHSQFAECSLLRIYWYDGRDPRGVVTEQHQALARLDDIKMRYGTLNAYGQQKGVDGLLMADLLALAQNRAITSAIILSGDADLAPGVGAAQMLGVRIHRLGINGQSASSPILLAEADKNIEWAREAVEGFVRKAEFQDARIISTPLSCAVMDEAAPSADGDSVATPLTPEQRHLLDLNAQLFAASLSEAEKDAVRLIRGIPPELDKRLLFQAKLTMRRFLSPEEKTLLRDLVQTWLTASGDTLAAEDAPDPSDPCPPPSDGHASDGERRDRPPASESSSRNEEEPLPPATQADGAEAGTRPASLPPDATAEAAPLLEISGTPLLPALESLPPQNRECGGDKKLLLQCAAQFVDALSEEEKSALRDCPRIPQEYDRDLLYQSRLLLQRHLWPEEKVLLRAQVQTLLQGGVQDIELRLSQCADVFVEELSYQEFRAVQENYGIPPELDRRLLFLSRETLHRPLFDSEKNLLRTLVRQRVESGERRP